MPFITVQLNGDKTDDVEVAAVTEVIAGLTRDLLGKDPKLTAIAVSYIAPRQWTIAGQRLSDQRKRAYWVDIKITDATNTKGDMARYIAAVHKALSGLLGNVHEESYVLVHAVHASAYGYGGLTQEHRYIEAQQARS